MDPVNADLDRLLAHSRAVEYFADRVANAVAAAEHLSGLDDAYGVFGRPFVSNLMQMVHDPHITAIRDAARALQGVGDRLRSNASDFGATDKGTEGDLGSAGEPIPNSDVPGIGGQP